MKNPLPNDLNPGIRKLVRVLNNAGFMTTDSGDGETHDHACDRDYGYVSIVVTDKANLIEETDRLKGVLSILGIPTAAQGPDGPTEGHCTIQAMYDPVDGFAIIDVAHVHDRMLGVCNECGELPCQCCDVCRGPCRGH